MSYIDALLGFVLSVVGMLIGPSVEEFSIWRLRMKSTELTGYYRTTWKYKSEENDTEQEVYDVVYLEQRGRHVKGIVYFTTDKTRAYTFRGKKESGRISGKWENKTQGYEGDFTLVKDPSGSLLTGFWAGLDKRSELQVERWIWHRTREKNIPKEISTHDFDPKVHSRAIVEFANRLEQETEKSDVVEVGGLKIRQASGVFSPHLGYISQIFYDEYVSQLLSSS